MPTPLFELALDTSGSPRSPRCAPRWEEAAPHRRGRSPASSAPPLWEKLAPNSAARVRGILVTALPLGERSVASIRGVVGRF